MKKVKHFLLFFVGVSKSEYSGIRLLFFTALFCLMGLFLANHYSFSPYSNFKPDSQKLDSLLVIMDSVYAKSTSPLVQYNLKKFDPNVASEEELLGYGFPAWLATRLIKYRSTGARFYKSKDLLKLYGFPDDLFAAIKNYVVIKDLPARITKTKSVEGKAKNLEPNVKKEKVLPVFDLNKADTSVLKTVKGIGSKLSARIVEYRTLLGGFVSPSQLYQVYGLDSSVIGAITKTSVITPDFRPTKINVNVATKEQLAAHPYINWTESKLIIAYRNQHGDFITLENVLQVYTIDTVWIKKNAPYLSF